jgi:hypothetical protein
MQLGLLPPGAYDRRRRGMGSRGRRADTGQSLTFTTAAQSHSRCRAMIRAAWKTGMSHRTRMPKDGPFIDFLSGFQNKCP